jgi:aromatic ring-opening dioxygenase catalytic subunit (LigB family)
MPFIHMFGNTFTEIPIVEVSIDSSLKPEKEWALGAAVSELRFVDNCFESRLPSPELNDVCRENGVLILAGGLSFHNLGDFPGFAAPTPANQAFHDAILSALQKTDVRGFHCRPGYYAHHFKYSLRNARPRCAISLHTMGSVSLTHARSILHLYGWPVEQEGMAGRR